MNQPPEYPPNPDEPRRDAPQGQYPPSGYPQSGQPQQPYSPPPAYGQPGGYGQQQGPNPYGGYGGGQGGSLYDNPYESGPYAPHQPGSGGYPVPARRGGPDEPSGARMFRRPTARATTSFAGAGAVLVVFGLIIWAGGYFAEGVRAGLDSSGPTSSSDDHRFLGAAFFAVATALGYVLVIRGKRGPLATAGTVLAALGVPLFLLFITLSVEDLYRNGEYPFNLDLVYVLSIVVWLATYLFVPGARGRGIFLGAAALGFSNYVALKAAGTDSLRGAVQSGTAGVLGGSTGTGIATAGLVVGLVYYGIAFALDRSGRAGAATPLVLAGFITTIGGVFAGIPDFEVGGTGAVLLILGIALTFYGGSAGRRFTAWVWSAAMLIGIVLVVGDTVDVDSDSYTTFGIIFIVIGAVLTAAATGLRSAMDEAPELE